MGSDDELSHARSRKAVQDPKKRQLPLGRERGFGFVKKVEPVLEAVLEERKERLTV
jgi:hypothetical protein